VLTKIKNVKLLVELQKNVLYGSKRLPGDLQGTRVEKMMMVEILLRKRPLNQM